MQSSSFASHWARRFVLAMAAVALSWAGACNRSAPSVGPDDNGGPADNVGDEGVVLDDALGFDGTVSGKVVEQQSTRSSFADDASAQGVPPSFDTGTSRVSFKDLSGRALAGPDGEPLDGAPLNADGTFTAEGLPVGADFAVCVDLNQDGVCEIETTINIPSTTGGEEGELDGVQVDPLTTMILAKLRALAEARGIDVNALPISPNAVMARIVAAYENLFADTGIDQEITLEDVAALSEEQLAELFDSIIPAGVKAGMAIVEGNLEASRAADAEALAVAAAAVFVQAGFPVADLPGPPDLSSLAQLEGVTQTTREEILGQLMPKPEMEIPMEDIPDELLEQFPDGLPEDFADTLPEEILDLFPDGIPEDFTIGPAQFVGMPPIQDIIYINSIAEPDRNFVSAEGEAEQSRPMLPILHDYLLMQMAQLQLAGETVTLGELYEVLTSLEIGLGVRLVYFVADPNFAGPPLSVFQTADGAGLAINFDRLLTQFMAGGFGEASPEDLQARDAELRQLMQELLGQTVPPSFESLYEGIAMDRVPTVEEVAANIREAQAHLPFSRSGPSAFFVVADGDPFRGDANVSAVTINAEADANGRVLSAQYMPDGTGKFYLAFTERSENEGIVQLIVRETGRPLHSNQGPVRVSIFDEALFAPVNGQPFASVVSESGVFYPGVNVAVVATQYVPEAPPPPDAVTPAQFESSGPSQQLFVLATAIGEGAEPVRVDYDFATGTATYNPFGRNLLMFLPDSHMTGQFALFNEATGRPASLNDPLDFFTAPPPPPENFEEFYNDEGMMEPPPPTEPIDDPNMLPPPPDGTEPPPDGTVEPLPDEPVEPPSDQPITPAQLVEEGAPVSVDMSGFILVGAESVVGLPLAREAFTHLFGTDVPNERYDASGDPYFDDIDGDGVQGENEPTTPHRPTLFDPNDWRSTDVRMYYRRADNSAAVTFEEIQFDAPTPMTRDGVALIPRNFIARLNAYRFGRPNTAINLLTAFAPPEFFDGTHALSRETEIDVFSAVAVVNLVMDQVFNVQAEVDVDGAGPMSRQDMLMDAHMFVAPIGDPFVLVLNGFRSVAASDLTP